MPFFPKDLETMSPESIGEQLFQATDDDRQVWRLVRLDANSLQWNDLRLGLEIRATHGFLIGLQEVSTAAEAEAFARRNKFHIVEGRGFVFRGVAELAISGFARVSQTASIKEDAFYTLRFVDGVEAVVGKSSVFFQRLIAAAAGETNSELPDPKTLQTLVVRNVSREDVTHVAELCLYYLRHYFPVCNFGVTSLEKFVGDASIPEEVEAPQIYDDLRSAKSYEAVAFFNRALESDAIAGFLYFYRVIEACFDHILDIEVGQWRSDASVDSAKLIQNIRKLTQKEDIWALRRVLSQILEQKTLDEALATGAVSAADAESFTTALYLRRNEIAHGRRGQHQQVLVPYAFPVEGTIQRDSYWFQTMKVLAQKCLDKWLLA